MVDVGVGRVVRVGQRGCSSTGTAGRAVVVNGQGVVDEGKHTGALAGRAVRRGRASP